MPAPADAIAAVTHPDPYPYYAELVARRPFERDASLGLWVAASAAAVTAVLTSELGRVRPAAEPVPRALAGAPVGDFFGRLVRMNDDAYHLRQKPTVSATLAMLDGAVVAGHARDAARALVAELDPAAHPERLIDFGFRLSAYALAGVLGLPGETRAQTAASVGDLVRALAPDATPSDVERGAAAVTALAAAVRALPRYAGAGDERVANVVGFFSQAYEATAGLVGNTLIALARHPDARARVARDATWLGAVVSEVVRHDAPVQNTRRFVAEAGVVAGQSLKAGDAVLVVLAAANRDPAVNPEPERFDPTRRERRTFTFGAGPHTCPGEALATAIATAGVAALLAAGVLPEGVASAPSYRPSVNTRVPVFAPAAAG
jgi:cytochrome P450